MRRRRHHLGAIVALPAITDFRGTGVLAAAVHARDGSPTRGGIGRQRHAPSLSNKRSLRHSGAATELGDRGAYLWHEYLMTTETKVEQLQQVVEAWGL